MALLEAKKQDIEEGLGQCIAQMVAARLFNQRQGNDADTLFGCVTTGEDRQFLQLEDQTVRLDAERYFINEAGRLLGVFKAIVDYFER